MFESACIYRLIIDPLLMPYHREIRSLVEPGQKVIDVACGPGSLSFMMAVKAKYVLGIDLSGDMIKFAESVKGKKNVPNVEFRQMDASKMDCFAAGEFDLAVMSMAIHQFKRDMTILILDNLKRIAKGIIILDYAFPFPTSFRGWSARVFESLAGKVHNGNFKSYLEKGGLKPVLAEAGLASSYETLRGDGLFTIIKTR